MPPLREALFPIDGDTVRGPDTDPYARGKIVGLYIAGLT
jgi:hypothetical protein